jgi:hypothetical protein
MQSYQQSLGEAEQKALCGVIQFLENTSFLVSFFNDDAGGGLLYHYLAHYF